MRLGGRVKQQRWRQISLDFIRTARGSMAHVTVTASFVSRWRQQHGRRRERQLQGISPVEPQRGCGERFRALD
eukprot:2972829-Prymnesium_polylepis.1